MKSLSSYIQEKLIIKKSKSNNSYKYFPETKKELKDIILQRIKAEGNEVDLNDIDVSEITDMSNLFRGTDFNGDISIIFDTLISFKLTAFPPCFIRCFIISFSSFFVCGKYL